MTRCCSGRNPRNAEYREKLEVSCVECFTRCEYAKHKKGHLIEMALSYNVM